MATQFRILHLLFAIAFVAVTLFVFNWFAFRARTFTTFGGPAVASQNLNALQTSAEIESFITAVGFHKVEPIGTHVSDDPSFSVVEFEKNETGPVTKRITVTSVLRSRGGIELRTYRFNNFWMAPPAYERYHNETQARFNRSVVDFRERLTQFISASDQFLPH